MRASSVLNSARATLFSCWFCCGVEQTKRDGEGEVVRYRAFVRVNFQI